MVAPAIAEIEHAVTRLDYLRKAIRNNRIAFPAQVPVFACQHRADIQWRLVSLFFVHGWSAERLGQRYKVSSRRVHQLLRLWVNRALALGYLQEIPPINACELSATSTSHEGREVEMVAAPLFPLAGLAAGAGVSARPE
jgi:hypothetical protein